MRLLESWKVKKPEYTSSLTSYYCCWAIAKVKLGVHRRYVHEKGRLLIPHWHVSILGQSMYSRGGMYVRGQRANFLSTKNLQILYFALVYTNIGKSFVWWWPNGPVVSCLFDFDIQAWIVMARSSHHHYHSGSEKGEVDETYQDPQKMSGDQKEEQKTENSNKCQEPSL